MNFNAPFDNKQDNEQVVNELMMISSQRPVITNPLPPSVTVAELVEPSEMEARAANDTMMRAVRNAYAENVQLRDVLAKTRAFALSQPDSAYVQSQRMNAAVFEAQRRMIAEDTPVPWTSLPANAVSVAAAKRYNMYESPGELFLRQPPSILPCDDRALNGQATGTPNYAVALDNVLNMGNQPFPQPAPFSVDPPHGTVPVQMNVNPVSAAVGGPMDAAWTTRPPVLVEPLHEKMERANGAAQLAVQSWLSFGSPFWPGESPL